MNEFFQTVEEHIATGRKLDAFDDRFLALSVRNWELGIHDKLTADTIINRVRWRQRQVARGEAFPFRRARGLRTGEILLGWDLGGAAHSREPIYVPKKYFTSHAMSVGTNGSGKSSKQAFWAQQFNAASVSTWQISCEKDDLRGQLPWFQGQGIDLPILRAADLKYNPLDAGANEPRAHLNFAISRFQGRGGLAPRSALILQAVCHKLYRDFGVLAGQRDRYPTLFHVYEEVRKLREENVAARDSLLARLGGFLERYTPRCGAWLKGWRPTDLARHSIIFEFRAAGGDLKHFLVESLLDHVFQHAIEQGALNRDLWLLIFLDDGQRIASCADQAGMTDLDEKMAVIRSTGIGVCFIVQTAYGMSPYKLGNINVRSMARMADPEGWVTMGRSLDLNPNQLEWVKANLVPGRFAGIITTGTWHEPFLFEVPHVKFSPGVTEVDILASQRPLDSLPVVFAEEFRHWEPHSVVNLGDDPDQPSLSPAEQRLLEAVCAEPGRPAGHYAKKLGMNGKVARTARERLVQLGRLREERLQLTPKGKPSIVLIPLPAAPAGAGATPDAK